MIKRKDTVFRCDVEGCHKEVFKHNKCVPHYIKHLEGRVQRAEDRYEMAKDLMTDRQLILLDMEEGK